MPATNPVRLCGACDGTGTVWGKRRFLGGAIIDRLPDLAPVDGKPPTPPECGTCGGDGYVWVASAQHP